MIVTHDPSITQRTDQTIILSDGEIIDQTVARALPFLSHPQMLAATSRLKSRSRAWGENSPAGAAGRTFLYDRVRRSGDYRQGMTKAKEMQLARLGHGQFFGEVELTQGGHSIASVQACGPAALSWRSCPRNYFVS